VNDILDRSPPFELEAEKAVLCSVLLSPDMADEVGMILKHGDFYDDANSKLFQHLFEMHDAGKKLDITLIVNKLKSAGDLELIGGMAYLAEVSQAAATAAHAVYYAKIVREAAVKRRVIEAGTGMIQRAHDDQGSAEDLLSRAESDLFSIQDLTIKQTSDIREVLHESLDSLDERMAGNNTRGVSTGIEALDELTGGLRDGELIILAARPSIGKSACAATIARNVATQGKTVLFVSLEMKQVELVDRLLSAEAMVDSHKMRNGTIDDEERRKVVEAAGKLSNIPIYFDDYPTRTMSQIASLCRLTKRKRKALDLLVIDYLQLITPDDYKIPREQQVARISARCKAIAKELDIPVMALAQVNRKNEDQKEKRPTLSMLRESGSLENDADVVMFVHREEYYLRGEERKAKEGEAEIIIAKQRNGRTGTAKCLFLKKHVKFVDVADPKREHDHYADRMNF